MLLRTSCVRPVSTQHQYAAALRESGGKVHGVHCSHDAGDRGSWFVIHILTRTIYECIASDASMVPSFKR
eukprot:4610911-Pleurochrysis_carterae.AAC.1